MNPRRKHQLPTVYRLSQFKFDIKKLQEEASKLMPHMTDVISANKHLCSNNHELVESVYSHFRQISLTEYSPESAAPTKEQCAQLGETAGIDHKLTRTQKYKLKISNRTDRPELDEHNYNKPTQHYKNSYFEEVISQFKEEAIRVRLVEVRSQKSLTPHIDYDPTYAVRVIVPIFTNDQCVNLFWRKNVQEEYHLPADGSAYFLNIGFKHSVENRGSSDRISLMFSLNGQSDLHDVPEYKDLNKSQDPNFLDLSFY